MKMRKKLIEVALPLEAINKASAREKSIRHGHPSTLHLWWARRPLAAARAVIFAQMVDDPSSYVDDLRSDPKLKRKAESLLKARKKLWEQAVETERLATTAKINAPAPGPEPTLDDILAEQERERLFRIIEELVQWENTTNEKVLQKARDEIWQSWRRTCAENTDHPRAAEIFDRNKLPAFHDPFAGGGALPLEAQRLGLEAYASDLNPVAVLINKAMIEIPPKFAGWPPVNPESRKNKLSMSDVWKGAQGLADDVRYYGQWIRNEAEKKIGHLYPKVKVTAEMTKERPDLKKYIGKELTVIAWIWARTVKSPNPAFNHIDVPLASTFMLSTKKGKEAYVEPLIGKDGYKFTVKVGKPKDVDGAKSGTKLARGANFKCLMSDEPIEPKYIYAEANAGRMNTRLMAIVTEGDRGRIYLAPNLENEKIATEAKPEWKPEVSMPDNPRWFSPPLYGLKTFGDLFTPRQLVALTTFSDLVSEAREKCYRDCLASLTDSAQAAGEDKDGDDIPLAEGGTRARAYADAVAVYLGFAVDYASNYWSVIATPAEGFIRGTFARQALPMTWDFAEAPPFGNTSGNWLAGIEWISKALILFPSFGKGISKQDDAMVQNISYMKIISTDPPYCSPPARVS